MCSPIQNVSVQQLYHDMNYLEFSLLILCGGEVSVFVLEVTRSLSMILFVCESSSDVLLRLEMELSELTESMFLGRLPATKALVAG